MPSRQGINIGSLLICNTVDLWIYCKQLYLFEMLFVGLWIWKQKKRKCENLLNKKVSGVWDEERGLILQEEKAGTEEPCKPSRKLSSVVIENAKITNKKATKRQSNPPPKQKSPQTLSAVLCNKSDSVMQGGEESESERTINKSRERNATLWAGRFVVGFCCVYFIGAANYQHEDASSRI